MHEKEKHEKTTTKDDQKDIVILPYIQNISEATERVFRKSGVKIAHKPTSSLRNKLCRLKDPIKPHDKAGVVYSIPCHNCDQVYVGKTGKQLKNPPA